jgi:hypothetical protein
MPLFSARSSIKTQGSSTGITTEQSKGYFENDMQVGRVGVTRYFSLGN